MRSQILIINIMLFLSFFININAKKNINGPISILYEPIDEDIRKQTTIFYFEHLKPESCTHIPESLHVCVICIDNCSFQKDETLYIRHEDDNSGCISVIQTATKSGESKCQPQYPVYVLRADNRKRR